MASKRKFPNQRYILTQNAVTVSLDTQPTTTLHRVQTTAHPFLRGLAPIETFFKDGFDVACLSSKPKFVDQRYIFRLCRDGTYSKFCDANSGRKCDLMRLRRDKTDNARMN